MGPDKAILNKIKVYGIQDSKNAYVIREFLMRSDILPFKIEQASTIELVL
jgi:hypothetical protein